VPKGTPKNVTDTLLSAATRAVMSPDVRDKLRAVDTVPIALSPSESVAWLRTNRQKWTDVVTKMNIRAE
jgi:tripartite-type tricarboxylate transporter receptor subunit TctC